MNSKFLKVRLSVTWVKYLGAKEKHSIVCDFGDKLYGKIKTSISVWGIVGGYWGSCQVLRVICIDDSLSQICKILCKQVFHKCVDSCAQFVNQNGLNSQLAIRLGGSQRSNLNGKYLSGKYPDSFIWVYCVQHSYYYW